MDFSDVAPGYVGAAVVQQKAAERLFQLLRIKEKEDIIDVGCGSGRLTQRIRTMTAGRVVGIDPAPGMIREALKLSGDGSDSQTPSSGGVDFRVLRAQELPRQSDLKASFDVVFCNSTLHWIRPLQGALQGFRHVLRPGGRVGIQAAAMSEYCPNFIRAVEKIKNDPRTKEGFASFLPPWTFLESEEAYKKTFSSAGFKVPYVALETVESKHSLEEAYGIFAAGAAMGYLDEDNYRNRPDHAYLEIFLQVIKEALAQERDRDGLIELSFHRVYLIAFL